MLIMKKVLLITLSILTTVLAHAQKPRELTIKIDIKNKAQRIDNFGAAGAWFTEGIAKNWPAQNREQMAEWLFSKEFDLNGNPKGIGLSAWRFNMSIEPKLQSKVDSWVEGAAVYVVTTYRDEITSLITDTVAAWDPEHTTKKIEAHIGRDLQFIRINGTVVGSLAGLVIYTVSRALGA